MNNEWKIKVMDNHFSINTGIYIYRYTNKGTEIQQCDKVITIKEGELNPKPTLSIARELLTPFMDALKKYGVRPTDQSLVEGKLIATNYHLEDMRTLLKLNKDLLNKSK